MLRFETKGSKLGREAVIGEGGNDMTTAKAEIVLGSKYNEEKLI